MSSSYYLGSDHYVPERIASKIDSATSSFIENGLYKFYKSLDKFTQKLSKRMESSQTDDDDIQALSMEQLKRPMIFISCLWGLAMVLFIGEFIIFKLRQWQENRRQQGKQKLILEIIGVFTRKPKIFANFPVFKWMNSRWRNCRRPVWGSIRNSWTTIKRLTKRAERS